MFDAGKLRSVGSLNAAGWSLRATQVGQVVECSWMDGRCGQLRSVESLNAAGWMVVAGS